MNIGPWMSWSGFAANIGFVVVAGAAAMITFRIFRPTAGATEKVA
jgi:hypothetical protein